MSCRGFEPVCTNNELREYFSAKGLTYDSIDEGDILILCMMLQKELKKSNKAGETSVTMTLSKQVHSERVAKNPDRIAYAIQQFEAHGIEYQLKNEQTGHFHCWRKSDDKLFQFYAGTGKIQGFTQVRGIHSLIQMLEG